ncbi:manganese transporter permease [Rhodobacterales bacterium HKCCE3408]|nr:manganese transporter permease [Rhodobacterales bacterium HKCCE3408]
MSLAARLWRYQAERFPLARTVPLLAVFSAAAVTISAVLAGRPLPGPLPYAIAFLLGMILFFQLRVADEHKDYADDCLYRPERAVPRGLVSLDLLARLAGIAGVVAVVASLLRPGATILVLFAVWIWFLLMLREFFVAEWLKARPVLYLVSHMAILPLIDLLLTSLEWGPHDGPPAGIWSFLALSFVNGCVLEIGRKTWAPESERTGVETYSKLWGPAASARAFAGCVLVAAVLLVVLGVRTKATWPVAVVTVLGALGCLWVARGFIAAPTKAAEKRVDLAAGLWVFACYAAAGLLPLLFGARP